jgi:hypothetical protein
MSMKIITVKRIAFMEIETKKCEQCLQTKAFSDFHRRKNKTDGRMRICALCYEDNLRNSRTLEKERLRQRELDQQQRQREHEEQARLLELERTTWRQAIELWHSQQPDRRCIACLQLLPSIAFGYSELKQAGDEWIPKLHQRCQACHTAMREQQAQPCCLCGKKTMAFDFLNHLHGFALFGGGTAIYLCCRTCEVTFLALPEDKQRFYIRSRCHLAFPDGQLVYGLLDPESKVQRYVGRTNNIERRFREHINTRSSTLVEWGSERKLYYTRSNWIYDLHQRKLLPEKTILIYVEIAPRIIEWEYRYIYHGIQCGYDLLNHEIMDDKIVTRVHATSLNFLSASFEELVEQKFFSPTGIEAFVRTWYR